MKRIDNLHIFSSGRSRGRIVLITKRLDRPGEAARIIGTRVIVFSSAVYDLSILVKNHSPVALGTIFPGGISSSQWQAIRHSPQYEYTTPTSIPNTPLTFSSFGANSGRIAIIAHSRSNIYGPQRVGNTSMIATNPAAYREFKKWFRMIPRSTEGAIEAFGAVIPQGLGGGTLNSLRAALL